MSDLDRACLSISSPSSVLSDAESRDESVSSKAASRVRLIADNLNRFALVMAAPARLELFVLANPSVNFFTFLGFCNTFAFNSRPKVIQRERLVQVSVRSLLRSGFADGHVASVVHDLQKEINCMDEMLLY